MVNSNASKLKIETGFEGKKQFIKIYDEFEKLLLHLPNKENGDFLGYYEENGEIFIAVCNPQIGPCNCKFTENGLILIEKYSH